MEGSRYRSAREGTQTRDAGSVPRAYSR